MIDVHADPFDTLADPVMLASLEPETREKVEELVHFRTSMETLNTQALMTLLSAGLPNHTQAEQFEYLDKLYEMMAKDLQDLRVKLFGMTEEGKP